VKEKGFFKGVLIAVLIASYAFASHFALVLPEGKKIAAALALGVPAVVLTMLVFQWVKRRLADNYAVLKTGWIAFISGMLSVLPMAIGLWLIWPILIDNAATLYFAQHVGTNALLAWVFGHTLMAGSTPLVVSFARIVDPALPSELETYARKVTVAWTLFFVITCVVSAVLFLAASLPVWSTFAVLLQWPSVAVFFVGEYLLRRYLFRQFKHANLRDGFDAYLHHQAGPDAKPAALSKF
jgi:uncharacterized membrane protein